MDVRHASPGDLDSVVRLTRGRRAELARCAPVYFNPAEGADEGHAGFLEFMIASDDFRTYVLHEDQIVGGFFVLVAHVRHTWIDDLCITDSSRWADALTAIETIAERPWVTCVPTADHTTSSALIDHGVRSISSYWARSVLPDSAPAGVSTDAVILDSTDIDPAIVVPAHTFGGKAFAPDTPNALVLTHDDGYVIGSPPVTPPIYDPGGPTTVVDQIVGRDRASLLAHSIEASARRGDAQLVVVVGENDLDLAEHAEASGFTRTVELFGTTAS